MSGLSRKHIHQRSIFILPIIFLFMLLINVISDTAFATSATTQVNATKNVIVNIQNFKFVPQTITIKAGQTITWINRDHVLHTLGSQNGLVKCGALAFGQSYSQTFTQPGIINYSCPMHPFMLGKIIVRSS